MQSFIICYLQTYFLLYLGGGALSLCYVSTVLVNKKEKKKKTVLNAKRIKGYFLKGRFKSFNKITFETILGLSLLLNTLHRKLRRIM